MAKAIHALEVICALSMGVSMRLHKQEDKRPEGFTSNPNPSISRASSLPRIPSFHVGEDGEVTSCTASEAMRITWCSKAYLPDLVSQTLEDWLILQGNNSGMIKDCIMKFCQKPDKMWCTEEFCKEAESVDAVLARNLQRSEEGSSDGGAGDMQKSFWG